MLQSLQVYPTSPRGGVPLSAPRHEPECGSPAGSGPEAGGPPWLPLSRPDLDPGAEGELLRALRAGHLGGNGPETARAEELLRRRLGCEHILLTSSGSHALEMALGVLNLEPGAEVICPSFDFPATANAILAQGLRPRFAEIDPLALTLDPTDAERRIGPRTAAIAVMHYGGMAASLDRFEQICAHHGLALIEDAAHAFGSRHRGRSLGTIGDAGALSFHATKHPTCGEGGALLLGSSALMEAAEQIQDKGTDRRAFLRGQRERYQWVRRGSSPILSDLLAALLCAQLEHCDEHRARRLELFARYQAELEPLAAARGYSLPALPAHCEGNAHTFWLLTASPSERDPLLAELHRAGIGATFHFQPLHTSPFGREALGCRSGDLPLTEEVAARLIRLPLFAALSDAELARVIAALWAAAPRG